MSRMWMSMAAVMLGGILGCGAEKLETVPLPKARVLPRVARVGEFVNNAGNVVATMVMIEIPVPALEEDVERAESTNAGTQIQRWHARPIKVIAKEIAEFSAKKEALYHVEVGREYRAMVFFPMELPREGMTIQLRDQVLDRQEVPPSGFVTYEVKIPAKWDRSMAPPLKAIWARESQRPDQSRSLQGWMNWSDDKNDELMLENCGIEKVRVGEVDSKGYVAFQDDYHHERKYYVLDVGWEEEVPSKGKVMLKLKNVGWVSAGELGR
jgi:hypothetical protein